MPTYQAHLKPSTLHLFFILLDNNGSFVLSKVFLSGSCWTCNMNEKKTVLLLFYLAPLSNVSMPLNNLFDFQIKYSISFVNCNTRSNYLNFFERKKKHFSKLSKQNTLWPKSWFSLRRKVFKIDLFLFLDFAAMCTYGTGKESIPSDFEKTREQTYASTKHYNLAM